MIRNKVQIYSEYSNTKYPLSDTHEESIPFNLLVDAAIAAPEDYMDITLTSLINTQDYVYLSIEAGTEPIGHVIVTDPRSFVIYPLTMFYEGAGWVVFGPGLDNEFSIKDVAVPFDPRCVMPNLKTQNEFTFSVNGVEYTMPNTLNIRTNSLVGVTDESRIYRERPETHLVKTADSCLTLRRNDSVVDLQTLGNDLAATITGDALFTINDRVTADANGNVNIRITRNGSVATTADVSSGAPIGVHLLTEQVTECDNLCEDGIDRNKLLRALIQEGQNEHGFPYILPLDGIIEKCDRDKEEPYPDCDSDVEALPDSSGV